MPDKKPQPAPPDALPVPVTQKSFHLVPLDELKDMCKAIDDAKREVMQAERDYMVIPGTKKPSLLKPGGEKLMKLFNLSPRFFPDEIIEEHHMEYSMPKTVWENSVKTTQEVDVRGWYFYRIRCELFDKTTGLSWGDGVGTCSSNERPGQPANTIIKMAQKSAMLGAVLMVCNASDLFTQDMDEPQYGNQKHSNSDYGNQQSGGPTTTTSSSGEVTHTDGVLKRMKSKYDKSKCGHCGYQHILMDDPIVFADGKWGAEECWKMRKLEPATVDADTQTDEKNRMADESEAKADEANRQLDF